MNKPVHITLAEPFGSFVDGEVESGRFETPDAVIEAALRLLEREQHKLESLRQALIEGEQSGPSSVLDPDALMAKVHESWKSRG